MEANYKISKTEYEYKHFDIFNDKATKNKISRHLIDINDIISEEDIRNIKVSIPGSENNDAYREKLITS